MAAMLTAARPPPRALDDPSRLEDALTNPASAKTATAGPRAGARLFVAYMVTSIVVSLVTLAVAVALAPPLPWESQLVDRQLELQTKLFACYPVPVTTGGLVQVAYLSACIRALGRKGDPAWTGLTVICIGATLVPALFSGLFGIVAPGTFFGDAGHYAPWAYPAFAIALVGAGLWILAARRLWGRRSGPYPADADPIRYSDHDTERR